MWVSNKYGKIPIENSIGLRNGLSNTSLAQGQPLRKITYSTFEVFL